VADPLPAELGDALAAGRARLGPFAALKYYDEVASTNDLALALAGAGAPGGTSVLAGAQRAGRGRRGREWYSPPGAGLYLSVIVRPQSGRPGLSLVTLAAGVALARAVRAATGLDCELKWPNDLVTGRPWRKLAGVLCEASGVAGESVDAVVVGVGVNLLPAAYPPEFAPRATSLELELSKPVDRPRLVVEILAELAGVTGRLWSGDRAWVLDEWRRLGRAGLGGAVVRWNDRDGERQGMARDIDADGALLVDAGGRRERLVAGDVRWDRLIDG
jgi:BirA family biotin operon repressor/biotin-[acetyl-CoA-carboxylase] ligase